MEIATATSARGGGQDHAQLVLTAEKLLLHLLSNTECPPHAGAGPSPGGQSEHNLALPSRSLYCIEVKG